MISLALAPLLSLGGSGGWGREAPGNSFRPSGDALKEIGTSFHHPFCKLIIAQLTGNCLEFFKSYAGTQITLSLR